MFLEPALKKRSIFSVDTRQPLVWAAADIALLHVRYRGEPLWPLRGPELPLLRWLVRAG